MRAISSDVRERAFCVESELRTTVIGSVIGWLRVYVRPDTVRLGHVRSRLTVRVLCK